MLYQVRCNEAGAILLYQEVTLALEAINEWSNQIVCACFSYVFQPLLLALNLLTLDKVGSIGELRKSQFYADGFLVISKENIRKLLKCRVEFNDFSNIDLETLLEI